MQNRHLVAALLLTLALGACGGDGPESHPATAPTTEPDIAVVQTTAVSVAVPTTVAAAPAAAPVRTDDLEADLRAVDQELGGAQQSVNQANDTSPDRADD
jgi:hypothetical protein